MPPPDASALLKAMSPMMAMSMADRICLETFSLLRQTVQATAMIGGRHTVRKTVTVTPMSEKLRNNPIWKIAQHTPKSRNCRQLSLRGTTLAMPPASSAKTRSAGPATAVRAKP